MRWIGQIVQAVIFILLLGGFMAYIADRTEQQDASQRCLRCRKPWDPNHLLVETSDQIRLRRQEMDSAAKRSTGQLPVCGASQQRSSPHRPSSGERILDVL
jgi:hypothetical protein